MANKRDQILNAIGLRFQNILTANGYNTDAGLNVAIWRVTPYAPAELPALNIQDFRAERSNELTSNKNDWLLTVRVGAVAPSTQLTDGTLRKLIADVYKAIGVDETFGGLAIATELQSDEMQVDQKESRIAIAMIEFLIQYRTTQFQED